MHTVLRKKQSERKCPSTSASLLPYWDGQHIVVATQSQDVSNTANSANAGSGSTNEVLQAETGVISIMITMPEDTTSTVTVAK